MVMHASAFFDPLAVDLEDLLQAKVPFFPKPLDVFRFSNALLHTLVELLAKRPCEDCRSRATLPKEILVVFHRLELSVARDNRAGAPQRDSGSRVNITST